MQRGLATLEIILAIMIIALLMTAAVPNALRMLDSAALDYETKRFYSELRFLQAIDRSGTINNAGTDKKAFDVDAAPHMQIAPENFSYQILRGNVPLREVHYMQNIKGIAFKNVSNKIYFDTTGQATNPSGSALNGRLILTSQLDRQSTIIFDSVGRIRGGRDDE